MNYEEFVAILEKNMREMNPSSLINRIVLSTFLIVAPFLLFGQEVVNVTVNRKDFTNIAQNLVIGELSVDGNYIGETYERTDLRINSGVYPGKIRRISKKHAVGPFGQIGEVGDFLLEIGNVTWTDGTDRTNLLFHGGNKAEHSKGCIMLGPIPKDSEGNRFLPADHTLRKLRVAIYGNDADLVEQDTTVHILITITE